MQSFADFLMGDAAGRAPADEPMPLPEAQCMELREVFAAYTAGCPFKPGDLVTPRPNCDMKGKGRPHIILDVLPEPVTSFQSADPTDTCSNSYGRRIDVRVASFAVPDQIGVWWMESWQLEPYAGPLPN
jgi:hypothetical protein